MLIERTESGGVLEIVLNDPKTRNAITGPMAEQLSTAIHTAADTAEIRVILLYGADNAFCSGLNLKEFNAQPPPDWLPNFQKSWRAVHKSFYQCTTPVVVALQKYAINGGAAIALAGDLLVVGDDSFLQIGEVRQGMAAPYNIAWLRLKQPESVINQLAITGRRFSGSELLRLGVAHEAPPSEDVLSRARAIANELAQFPDNALMRIKSLIGTERPSADEWFDRFTASGGRRGPIPKLG